MGTAKRASSTDHLQIPTGETTRGPPVIDETGPGLSANPRPSARPCGSIRNLPTQLQLVQTALLEGPLPGSRPRVIKSALGGKATDHLTIVSLLNWSWGYLRSHLKPLRETDGSETMRRSLAQMAACLSQPFPLPRALRC